MMKELITIFSFLVMLVLDFLYFKWACENYDPHLGHNCEQCSEIKSERSSSILAMISVNLMIITFFALYHDKDWGIVTGITAWLILIRCMR